jgi:hypothetical protein
MQTLADRIRAFIHFTDECIKFFETPPAALDEPHPLFAGVVSPFPDPEPEPPDIPADILERGDWSAEGIEQARSIAAELERFPWGGVAVRSLLRFIRALKGTIGPCGFVVREDVDRKLWEKVRANLEDATEYLIDGDKPAPANPGAGIVDGALSAYLASNPDASADDALAAMNAAGVKMTLDGPRGLRRNPLWKTHVYRRIAAYMDENPDATVQRIAINIGVVPSTIHKSRAYQERKEARNARRNARREKKRHEKKTEKTSRAE